MRIATEATVFGTFVYPMDATHTPLDEPTGEAAHRVGPAQPIRVINHKKEDRSCHSPTTGKHKWQLFGPRSWSGTPPHGRGRPS